MAYSPESVFIYLSIYIYIRQILPCDHVYIYTCLSLTYLYHSVNTNVCLDLYNYITSMAMCADACVIPAEIYMYMPIYIYIYICGYTHT